MVALLQEEVKLARDAERTADFKKSRCQAYVSQQQEVILKMLSVKGQPKYVILVYILGNLCLLLCNNLYLTVKLLGDILIA